MKPLLERARQALTDGDPAGPLVALLDAWRERPCGSLADLIDQVPVRWPPIADGKEWTRAAATLDPAALGRLLDEAPRVGDLEAFLKWPRDPRFARRAATWLARCPVGKTSRRAFNRALVELLAMQQDPAVADVLAAHKAVAIVGNGGGATVRYREVLAKNRSSRLALDEDTRKIAGELAHLLAARPAAAAADPLAAVYANPLDDGIRLVAADALTERGDPRGEMITLQLTSPGRRREKELERRFGRDWLGPLDAILLRGGVVYRRGFPSAARFRTRAVLPDDWDQLREWSTFEALDFEPAQQMRLRGAAELLIGGACRALRRVRGLEARDIEFIGRSPAPFAWEELHFTTDSAVPEVPLADLPLPSLRVLRITGQLACGSLKLLGSPLGQGLEHCTLVAGDPPDLVEAMRIASPRLQTLELGNTRHQWRVRLERTPAGWRADARLVKPHPLLDAQLARLPAGTEILR